LPEKWNAMGMSLIYNQISKEAFTTIQQKTLDNEFVEVSKYSKDCFYIEKSFEGLQFVFVKGLGEEVRKAFRGSRTICPVDFTAKKFRDLDVDEQFEIYYKTPQISFFSPDDIIKLALLFSKIEGDFIDKFYNSNELNDNRVYPEIWHDDNSENQVYNARDLSQNSEGMITFFSKVQSDGDYVILQCE